MRAPVLVIAVMLGLSACALPGRRPRPAALLDALPSPEVLQAVVEARRQAIHGLRAEAHIVFSSPERSGRARQILLVQRPDQLRVELFSPFGTAFVLATASGRMAAYVRDEHRLYRGAATPANLAHYAALELAVTDVVDLLLGNAPLRAASHSSVFADPASGQVRWRRETATGAQVVVFGGEPLVPVAVEELGTDNAALWRATFSEHEAVQGVPVPLRISLERPRQEQRVDITLDRPELNPPLGVALFTLQTPPGSEEVSMDEMVD